MPDQQVINRLNATARRHAAHLARLHKYVDECPYDDSDPRKRHALDSIEYVGNQLHQVHLQIDLILEADR